MKADLSKLTGNLYVKESYGTDRYQVIDAWMNGEDLQIKAVYKGDPTSDDSDEDTYTFSPTEYDLDSLKLHSFNGDGWLKANDVDAFSKTNTLDSFIKNRLNCSSQVGKVFEVPFGEGTPKGGVVKFWFTDDVVPAISGVGDIYARSLRDMISDVVGDRTYVCSIEPTNIRRDLNDVSSAVLEAATKAMTPDITMFSRLSSDEESKILEAFNIVGVTPSSSDYEEVEDEMVFVVETDNLNQNSLFTLQDYLTKRFLAPGSTLVFDEFESDNGPYARKYVFYHPDELSTNSAQAFVVKMLIKVAYNLGMSAGVGILTGLGKILVKKGTKRALDLAEDIANRPKTPESVEQSIKGTYAALEGDEELIAEMGELAKKEGGSLVTNSAGSTIGRFMIQLLKKCGTMALSYIMEEMARLLARTATNVSLDVAKKVRNRPVNKESAEQSVNEAVEALKGDEESLNELKDIIEDASEGKLNAASNKE